MTQVGEFEGETCNRKGCTGIIEIDTSGDGCCSCHIDPPCSYCTTAKEFCPECDWSAEEDQRIFNNHIIRESKNSQVLISYAPRPLDPTKIDWRYETHTHFSMKKVGIFPYGTSREELLKEIKGTFGGRFESFVDATVDKPGRFSYIAYTD